MRCFLVLAIALVLVPLFSRPAFPQEAPQECDNRLPEDNDFPEAGPTCKRKLKLAPWLGMPAVVFTQTGRCVLSVTVCGGERKCYRSEIRDQEDGWCKDFAAKYDWLANRTICCDPKCEKPSPWLDGLLVDPTKCKNRQPIQTTIDGRLVFLKMCGSAVFVHDAKTTDPNLLKEYAFGLRYYVVSKVGPTVCCNSFNESVRTGSSCDPRLDFDCDGVSNGMDVTDDGRFPDITRFAIAPGIPTNDTDPLPDCFWPPNPYECDCKWEMVQATRSLTQDRRHYRYEGRWRCPSTGKEIVTDRKAFETYPCGPGQERKSSILFLPEGLPFSDVWAEVPRVFRTKSSCVPVTKDS